MYNMICFVSIYAIHNLEIPYLIIIGDDPDAPSVVVLLWEYLRLFFSTDLQAITVLYNSCHLYNTHVPLPHLFLYIMNSKLFLRQTFHYPMNRPLTTMIMIVVDAHSNQLPVNKEFTRCFSLIEYKLHL
jgi:hypothetical protein